MSFVLVGNGSTTSSTAITTLTLTNQFVALPAPYSTTANTVVHRTEAGLQHTISRGQRIRQWDIELKLMDGSSAFNLEEVFDTLIGGWCFWRTFNGTFESATATTATDNQLTSDYADQYRNQIIVTTGGTGSGQVRRVLNSASGGGTITALSVVTWGTNPDATTTYELGWPVRFASPLQWTRIGVHFNAAFVFEEMLLGTTI